jgi:magnesium chelatase family protein
VTTHAPTVAFAGMDCLDVDVRVQISAGFVGFTNVGPIARGKGRGS